MNTGASCQFINKKAVKKAASILGMDVATALSVINLGKPLEYANPNLFNKLRRYYKGNDNKTYQAMAMLLEWSLSQGFDLLNWRTSIDTIEQFEPIYHPNNSPDSATSIIFRILKANKSFNIIPLHGFLRLETTPEYSEILDEFITYPENRIRNANIIWAHPASGKTYLHKQHDPDIIDFDSVYKSRLDTELGLNSDPAYKGLRKEWRKSHPEEYRNKILQYFDEAVNEARNTGKKLLVSDLIILNERANSLDLIVNMSDDIFIDRNMNREETTYESSRKWKDNINESINNLSDINHTKVVLYDGYVSDLIHDLSENSHKVYSDLPLKNKNGEIYGIAKGKNIYLNNKSTKTIDTPIHEYTHLWAKAMQFNNPKGWESVKSLLKNTEKWQEFSDLIQLQEGIYDENLVASEMLASYSGKINSERLLQLDNSLKSRIIQALEKFWNWIGKSLFKIDHFDSIEEVTDRVVYDLLNLTDLLFPETTDLIVNPEYISNVLDYNINPNQFIQAMSGKNNNPNHIIRNRAFNLLLDRGYSLEYLKSIITTPEDVNLFVAYFNLAKINRNIEDELSPEILSQLYLDAILAIQYKKYIDSPEYQKYSVSNDKDTFDLATLQLSSELSTIKKQINLIKEFPVLADEDSIALYLPSDTSEKAIQELNDEYKKHGLSNKFKTKYIFYSTYLPFWKEYLNKNPETLRELRTHSSFKYTSSKDPILNPAFAIAEILNELELTRVHEVPASVEIPEVKKPENIKSLLEKINRREGRETEIIDCWNNKDFSNPFGTSEKFPIQVKTSEEALMYFNYGIQYGFGDTLNIPEEVVEVIEQNKKIANHFAKIAEKLTQLVDSNKKVIFVHLSDNNSTATILRDIYGKLYNQKYNPSVLTTETSVFDFNPEIVPDRIKVTFAIENNKQEEIRNLQNLLTYIYQVRGNTNPEVIAESSIGSILAGDKQMTLQVLGLTSKQTEFLSQLLHLGYMMKEKFPKRNEFGDFDYNSYYGGLDITKSLQDLLEELYILNPDPNNPEIDISDIIKEKYSNNQLSDSAIKWINDNNIFNIDPESRLRMLLSAKSILFDNILRKDRRDVAIEVIQTKFANNFAPIKKRQIYSAGIIVPKTLKTRFNLDERGLPLIDSKFFRNITKSRYNLPQSIIENIDGLTVIHSDFFVRGFSRKYNIVLTGSDFSNTDTSIYGTPIQDDKIIIEDGWRLNPKTKEKMYKLSNLDNVMIFRDEFGTETLIFKNNPDSYQQIESLLTSDSDIITVEPFLLNIDRVSLMKFVDSILLKIKDEINTIPVFDSLIDLLLIGDDNWKELCISIYLDKNTKDTYKDMLAESTFIAFQNSLDLIALRIPTQSLLSIMSQTVKGLTNDKGNNVFITRWLFWLQGSDLDIDKAYILGRNFDKNGRFIHWSPLAKMYNSTVFEASLSLPGNSGYELIAGNQIWKRTNPNYIPIVYTNQLNSNWKLDQYITDYSIIKELQNSNPSKSTLLELERLKAKYLVFEELSPSSLEAIKIKILGELIKEVNSSKQFNISIPSNPTIDEIIRLINKHNLYVSKYQKEAQLNLNVTRMLQINKDPRNEIAAYSSIDDAMNLFLDPIKEISLKHLMSIDDGVSIAMGTTENAIGKDDVGVAANSMKVYFTTLLYLNKYFKDTPPSLIKQLLSSKKFKLNKIVLNYKNAENENVVEAHVVPTIADVQVPKEAIELYNNYMERTFPDEWEEGYRIEIPRNDASLSLSSIVSLATDNAKTLALSKINAGIELLCMHTYLTAIGFSPKTIVKFTTSPAFTKFASLIGDNVFDGEDGHIQYETWKSFEVWCRGNNMLGEYQLIKNLYNNAQEFKNFAGILKINQGVKNSEDSINIFFNFQNAIRSLIDIYNQNKVKLITDQGFVNPEKLAELILINSGFFTIENNNITCSISPNSEFFITLVEKIKSVNEKIKSQNIDLTKLINPDLYFEDESYRSLITDVYDIVKSTINVYDIINETPHFYLMLNKYVNTISQECELLSQYRFMYRTAPILYRNNLISNNKTPATEDQGSVTRYRVPKLFTKKLLRPALRAFKDISIFNFIKQIQGFKVSIDGFKTPFNIDFTTDDGIKKFCNFINKVLIPALKYTDLSENDGNNPFLLALEMNAVSEKEGKPFYGMNVNLNTLRNSSLPDLNTLFGIERGFNEVSEQTVFEALQNYITPNSEVSSTLSQYKVGELLWLYNLIMQQVAPSVNSYSGLFAKLHSETGNLIDKYTDYLLQLDKGEIELQVDPHILLACMFGGLTRRTKGIMRFSDGYGEMKIFWKENGKDQCKYFISAPETNIQNNDEYFKPEILLEAIKKGIIEVHSKEKC